MSVPSYRARVVVWISAALLFANTLLAATVFADSLSLTNASTANNDNVSVIFSGTAFFTNGVGQINFGGTTGSGSLSLQFSSNVTFKTLTMTGAGGTGVG